MRHVFVYYKNGLYNIIDKANPQVTFAKINDVLLFNAVYKRFGTIKGWHGILSEEINRPIVHMLGNRFNELVYKDKVYYPRYACPMVYDDTPVKKATFLRLQDGKEFFRGAEHMGSVHPFLTEWISQYDDGNYLEDDHEDDWEEYNDGET